MWKNAFWKVKNVWVLNFWSITLLLRTFWRLIYSKLSLHVLFYCCVYIFLMFMIFLSRLPLEYEQYIFGHNREMTEREERNTTGMVSKF